MMKARRILWTVAGIWSIVLLSVAACTTISSYQRKVAEDEYITLSMRYAAASSALLDARTANKYNEPRWGVVQGQSWEASDASRNVRVKLAEWRTSNEKPIGLNNEFERLRAAVDWLEEEVKRVAD